MPPRGDRDVVATIAVEVTDRQGRSAPDRTHRQELRRAEATVRIARDDGDVLPNEAVDRRDQIKPPVAVDVRDGDVASKAAASADGDRLAQRQRPLASCRQIAMLADPPPAPTGAL